MSSPSPRSVACSTSYTNQQIGRILRMFKWGVENEVAPASIFHALEAIAGLRKGRSGAKESDPVRPVPEAHVEAVRQRVSAQVNAIIDLQVLTGMHGLKGARRRRINRGKSCS